MDVKSSTVQLDTPDGKMEAFEARPKEGAGLSSPCGFNGGLWRQ